MIEKYFFAGLCALLGLACAGLLVAILGLHIPFVGVTIITGYVDRIGGLEDENAKLTSDLHDCNVKAATLTLSLKMTGDEVNKGNGYALLAATACQKTQEALTKGRANAEAIRNAPANSDPGAVYVGSLCGRPEARNLPACASSNR